MTKYLLTILLPLIAPTILYMVWLRVRRREEESGKLPSAWRVWPWLVAVGAVLVLITLLLTGLQQNVSETAVYEPSHLENGELIPGRFVEPE